MFLFVSLSAAFVDIALSTKHSESKYLVGSSGASNAALQLAVSFTASPKYAIGPSLDAVPYPQLKLIFEYKPRSVNPCYHCALDAAV